MKRYADGAPGLCTTVAARGAPPWSVAYGVATFLLLTALFAQLSAAIGLAVGVAITARHLALALTLATLATVAVGTIEGMGWRRTIAAVAAGAGILALAVVAAAAWWDFSYDGQAYHQSAIVQLVGGWNPLVRPLSQADSTHHLWLNHYLRGPEMAAAVVVAATGDLEAGKAVGLVLLVSAGLFGAVALRGAGARGSAAVAGAILATASPIAISQAATYYVDGQLSALFACAVALAWSSLRGPARSASLLLGAALALLAAVKFTGTVDAALLLAGYGAVALLMRPGWRTASRVCGLATVTGAAVLALTWQPLVTNTRDHGHPFYPLAGRGAIDVVSGQAPRFGRSGPVRRFLLSTFSESSAGRQAAPVAKVPVVVRGREIEAMAVPDVRIAGFGPLFALALVIGLAGIAASCRGGLSPVGLAGVGVAAAVLATVAINPGAWWARYVPQLWVAAVVALFALAGARPASLRLCGVAALVVLTADAGLVGFSVARHQRATAAAARAQLHDLATRGRQIDVVKGEMESVALRLQGAGLRARYVVPGCARALPLVGTSSTYCDVAADPLDSGSARR